ncbi:MAG: hypothetical protein FP814_12480, partial [Desulfobacterium sp.]|nr:hypothetical protein [Desulfobacterium sp.]
MSILHMSLQISSSRSPVISLSVSFVTSIGDYCKPDSLRATIQDSLRASDITKDIARKALSEMLSLQPPTTQGVFYFSPDFEEIEIIPDVVLLSLRPVELCRIIQGYQYITGNRVKANVGGLRAGCS